MTGRRLYIVFGLVFFGLLLLRIAFFIAGERHTFGEYIGQSVTLEGRVVNDPERRETSLHAHIDVENISGREVKGKVLAILPRATELEYGDTVIIEGKLAYPETFLTETGRTFDYPGYLKAKGISVIVRYATLEGGEMGRFSIQRSLYALKHAFERSLERLLPEPDVSLMEGILLGERRGIPDVLNQAFIIAGLVHIVVLSGYNIGIVSEYVLRMFSLFLPKKTALIFGGVGILLFALMAGAGATVVRATIMGGIAVLARYLERPSAALRALIFAALLMVLWNPIIALEDPSFILSVIATFGLITFSPSIERYVGKIPERWGLRSIAASTIAVQIYILPALLYMTGVLSVFAFPANLLVLPIIPLAMLFGFLAGAFGLLSGYAALPFAVLADMLLRYIVLIAEGTASLPYASGVVPAFPLYIAVLVYIPLTLFALWLHRTDARKETN